jgi:hypothetical protein
MKNWDKFWKHFFKIKIEKNVSIVSTLILYSIAIPR